MFFWFFERNYHILPAVWEDWLEPALFDACRPPLFAYKVKVQVNEIQHKKTSSSLIKSHPVASYFHIFFSRSYFWNLDEFGHKFCISRTSKRGTDSFWLPWARLWWRFKCSGSMEKMPCWRCNGAPCCFFQQKRMVNQELFRWSIWKKHFFINNLSWVDLWNMKSFCI